jgi:putative copper export protein
VLPLDLDVLRLFLHLLAATVWVGGQLVLAGLVPALRKVGPEVPAVAGRQFSRIAWAAFAVLVVTGVWNVAAVGDAVGGAYRTTLVVKLAVVVLSGVTALVHSRATTARGRAVSGALTGLTAVLALLLGVLLRG